MNPQQTFELMIQRHQAHLAEHRGCTLPGPQRPGSWMTRIQNWLSANKALYRATAPNA